ncbi:MAG: DUF86 domain-containing protein [Anaerolineae bacterium]|nr:DUF86 domain-containing protein [Anaerolineae bacterium]MDW8099569.1 DUF86 domain-containing protein [Anaerolineae bacterium]
MRDHLEVLKSCLEREKVLPMAFARRLAPMAGFRNILAHEYLAIDWDLVYKHLQGLDDFYQFAHYIREWLRGQFERSSPS